jgi:hypothetical protein
VPGLLFHDLRRTAVVNMDRAGVPRTVIKEITGHKTDSMFTRYRIVRHEDIAQAGQKMDQYFVTGRVLSTLPGTPGEKGGQPCPSPAYNPLN